MQPALMVIDDDGETRRFLAETLVEEGFPVLHEGGHGLAVSHAIEDLRPDVLFVAIEDPVPRAELTLDFIRGALPNAIVIGYTGTPTPDIARRAMRANARDLLEAPLSREDVRQAMAAAMRALERNGRLGPGSQAAGGVFGVVGQKGGIGKTTIATNLASVLASRTPSSVLIIDLDTRFGDVALAMDVPYEFTAANAARGIASLDREEFRNLLVQHESGAYVLPSPESPREWVDVPAQSIAQLIDFAAEQFDYVVLDTPGTLDETVAVALDRATSIVAVTSLDLTSIKNTNLLLGYMQSQHLDLERVVVTVSHNLEHNLVTMDDVAHVLDRRVNYEVPFDSDIPRAAQLGRPVTIHRPHSNAAVAYAGLAALLTGETITMPSAPAHSGILARLLGRGGGHSRIARPALSGAPGQ